MDLRDLEHDPDLMQQEPEAEAWSVTVDKKVTKSSANHGLGRKFWRRLC